MSPIEDDGQIEYLDNLKRKEIKIAGHVDARSLPIFAAQNSSFEAKKIKLVYRETKEKEVKISFPVPSNSGPSRPLSCDCLPKIKKLKKQNEALEAENSNLSRTLSIWKNKYQLLQSKYNLYMQEKTGMMTNSVVKNVLLNSVNGNSQKNVDETREEIFKCPVCKLEVKFEESGSHFKDDGHQMLQVSKCDDCKEIFYSSLHMKAHDLRQHTTVENLPEELKCEYEQCTAQFTSVKLALTHVEKYHGFECKECPKNFCTIDSLQDHFKKDHFLDKTESDELVIKHDFEDIIDTDGDEEEENVVHVEEFSNKKFKCPMCERTFDIMNTAKVHAKRIHKIECKICSKCDLLFSSSEEKLEHTKNVHSKEAKLQSLIENPDNATMVKCTVCGKDDIPSASALSKYLYQFFFHETICMYVQSWTMII